MTNNRILLKRSVARRNLERLSTVNPPEKPNHARLEISDPCQVVLNVLREWSSANAGSIDASIRAQVFGGKAAINWQTAFLPFMESMALYLRDYGLIREAIDLFKDYKLSAANDQSLLDAALDRYLSAQALIDDLAGVWGMDFIQITDLVGEHPDGHPLWDGPFCGAFVTSDTHAATPCIGLAFKGTKPTNLREISVDVSYQLRSAGAYLDGKSVSQGVYTGLFGEFGNDTPYAHILESLQTLSAQIPNTSGAPPRLHVTGHSLGGSYSTLCTAQLLIDTLPSPGREIPMAMGDEYTFGAPRVGDAAFADMVADLFGKHAGRSWRIVNEGDIVPRVPPSDLRPRQVGFYHVDDGIKIFDTEAPLALPSERGGPAPEGLKITETMKLIREIISTGFHLPTAYYRSLVYAMNASPVPPASLDT